MSETSKKNPVEECLMELRTLWEAFRSDSSKRLLIWRAHDDAVRMLQCFFEVQKLDSEFAAGDLFFSFDPVFEHSIQYSRELKESLAGQYKASLEDFKNQDLPVDWQPAIDKLPDSAAAFIQSLCSFGSKYHDTISHLAAVLMPKDVKNPPAFEAWLLRGVSGNLPERLRLAVIDSIESPRFAGLHEAKFEWIHFDTPDIDSMAIAQKTFAQESVKGPAGVFRNLLMGLVTLVEKGPADQVKMKAKDAMRFAEKQNWADQKVAVSMLVAGAMLKEKRFNEALQSYQGARSSAQHLADSGHPVGKQLVLQTLFGEAGVHFAAGAFRQAAASYDQAAKIAEKIPNPILAIEALRMGGFCHSRLDSPEAAGERAAKALKMGGRLKAESRGMTTLPLAAVDLLRSSDPDQLEKMEAVNNKLDTRIQELLNHLEQKAAELEGATDPGLLQEVEQTYEKDKAEALQAAEKEIDALADASGKDFSGIFGQTKKLLGPNWLLTSPIAFPKSPAAASSSSIRMAPL